MSMVVLRGILGWGNRKLGLEAYGPGGRWDNVDPAGGVHPRANPDGDLLGEALERAGALEGATLLVIAIDRHGDTSVLDQVEQALHDSADCLTAGCDEDADGACSRCGYRPSDLPAETSTLTDKETPMGSNLAEHARRELTLCRQMDEDPEYAESIVRAVEAFASFGHSGGSAAVAREQLYTLLGWGTLSPLTSAPDEWEDRSEESGYPMWQSRRDPAVFSDNGGKTWWHLDEKEAPDEAE